MRKQYTSIGGNPSSQNAEGRPWYFKLVFQNTFDFVPDNPSELTNLKTDISSQAAAIKQAAVAAFRKAYTGFSVDIDEGTAGTGDNLAYVVDGWLINPKTQLPDCGVTSQFGGHSSKVFYELIMEQAQWAINVQIKSPKDLKAALSRSDLITATGTGVGTTAAHEVAHQFLLEQYGMDDGSHNTYNGGDCMGADDPSNYTGDGIKWEETTLNALKSHLGSGWH